MSFYSLVKDNCKLVKNSNNRLHVFCCFCGKQLHSTSPNWEEWDHDIVGMFNIIESKVTYHLLFKCRKKGGISI